MSSSKLILGLLFLLVIMVIGMMTASWRVILYPYLLVIGISMLLGITKAIRVNPSLIMMPVTVTGVYIFLFVSLDYVTANIPIESEIYILGLTPSTALVFLGIWPMSLVVSLLYAWSFDKDTCVNEFTEKVNSTKIA